MRRLITALLALVLLLLTITGMKNADALARQSTSISLRWQQALAGGMMITGVEYALGLAFNRRHQIWDYRRMPLNLGGQICLPFTLAWCGLSALALGGMRLLPHSSRERISAI